MTTAATRVTPEESRAIGRLIVAVARIIVRMGGMWGTLTVLGVFVGCFAIYAAPGWWNMLVDGWDTIREWMDR